MWNLSVASHVQSGDDSISTAVREVNEEIGLQIEYKVQVRDFRFLTSFRNHHIASNLIENQYYDLFVYRKNLGIADLCYNDDEGKATRWSNYTQLQRLIKEGGLHPRLEWVNEVVLSFITNIVFRLYKINSQNHDDSGSLLKLFQKFVDGFLIGKQLF